MGCNRKREQKKTYICNSLDASSFAKRISWLKFEPKVSNFPVIEANLASITLAITVSLFLFSFSILLNVINIKYVEDFYCSSLDSGSPVFLCLRVLLREFFPVLFFYTFLVSLTYKALETFIGVGFLGLCGLLIRRSWRF